jgi:hypothetical protein
MQHLLSRTSALSLAGLTIITACSGASHSSPLPTPSSAAGPDEASPEISATLRWAGKRDSKMSANEIVKFPPLTHGWPPCLKERGCPFQPRVLPSCDSRLRPQTVHDVLTHSADLYGKELLVAGPLGESDASITLNTCEPCCVRYTTRLLIGSGSEHLLLHAYQSEAFACMGDRTRTCCGLASTSGRVIAQGVLRPGPYLDDPLLCDPGN